MASPFASQAQRDKWQQLVDEGHLTQAQYDARDKATGDIRLPPRATPRHRTVGASRAPAEARLHNRRY